MKGLTRKTMIELKDDRAQSFATPAGHITLRPGLNAATEAEVNRLRANRWFAHLVSIGRAYILDPDFGELNAEDQKRIIDLIRDPIALRGYQEETHDRGVKIKIGRAIRKLEGEHGKKK